MDYIKKYNLLIEKGKISKPIGYTETHHIIPRCLGGSDDKSNLVELSARQHFIAHLLLAKIYGGTLTNAVYRMSNNKRYSNRVYAKLKEVFVKNQRKLQTGRHPSDETLNKMRLAKLGIPSAKRGKKYGITKAKGQKKWTEEHRTLMSINRKGSVPWNKGKSFSEESKIKMSLSAKIRAQKFPSNLPRKVA